ncbi:MAG: hypothetical protein Kow0092_22580 [Deferrisomatales bacterium]
MRQTRSQRGPDGTLRRLQAQVLEASDDAVVLFRPATGKVIYANPAFTRLTGIPPGQTAGERVFACLGREASRRLRRELRALGGEAGARVSFEMDLEIPLHPARCMEVSLLLLRPTPRRPVVCARLRDVTFWKDKARELRRRYRFFRNLVGGSLQSIIVTDTRGKILLFNRGAEALLGYREEEVIESKYIQDMTEGNGARQVMDLTRGPSHGGPGLLDRGEAILISKNRERIPVWLTVHMLFDENGAEEGAVTFVHDMRETMEMERRLEEVQMQLIHADKMASLGKLAAGVAHEINNPLGGILLFGGLLLEDMDFSDPRREDMDRIVQEARRCREIVNSLLDFAHQKKRYHEPVDLNAAVEQCLSLLGNKAIFHNISVNKELEDSLPLVTGNPSQIKQVFTNIVTNAVDAMDGEGVLTVRSYAEPDGARVCVAFSDTGPGIPPNVQGRIFDPLFTTKEPGKGTGLGLSLSYNIVKMHRGDIRVHCPPTGGTTFTVVFPSAEEEEEV